MRGPEPFVIVVGHDTGFARYGYAAAALFTEREEILEMGVIRTEKSAKKTRTLAACDDFRRGRELSRHLIQLTRPGYDRWGGGLVRAHTYEAISLPRNARTSSQLGIAFGALSFLAEDAGVPALEVSPQALKLAVVGSKLASKEEVRDALCDRFKLDPERWREIPGMADVPRSLHEHAWDALGSIVACLDSDILRAIRPRG